MQGTNAWSGGAPLAACSRVSSQGLNLVRHLLPEYAMCPSKYLSRGAFVGSADALLGAALLEGASPVVARVGAELSPAAPSVKDVTSESMLGGDAELVVEVS